MADENKINLTNKGRIVCSLIRNLLRLLGLIPRPWSVSAGNCLGRLWYGFDRRHREIALKNLAIAFGNEKKPRELETLAKSVFRNLSQIIFEMGWSLRLDKEELQKFFSFRGMEHLRIAHLRKKGILLLTGHMGNWELMSVAAALSDYPVNVLYRPLDHEGMNLFFYRFRTRFGVKMVAHVRSMRKILQILKKGESIAILMDQNVDWYEGVFVDLFGERACTNIGPALIALGTGSPVLPVFLLRDGLKFVIEFGEEIPAVRTGDKRKDIEETTQRYNQVLETYIRRFPEQWFWIHQRWKTRPYQPWPRDGAPCRKDNDDGN
ncbi:MAG: lysophospholipid acyltransferase family protein [Thermodesulfobacteriota bacterium]